jgi:hypothetical protein
MHLHTIVHVGGPHLGLDNSQRICHLLFYLPQVAEEVGQRVLGYYMFTYDDIMWPDSEQ